MFGTLKKKLVYKEIEEKKIHYFAEISKFFKREILI